MKLADQNAAISKWKVEWKEKLLWSEPHSACLLCFYNFTFMSSCTKLKLYWSRSCYISVCVLVKRVVPPHHRSSHRCRRYNPHRRRIATRPGCSGRFHTGTGWLHIQFLFLQRQTRWMRKVPETWCFYRVNGSVFIFYSIFIRSNISRFWFY